MMRLIRLDLAPCVALGAFVLVEILSLWSQPSAANAKPPLNPFCRPSSFSGLVSVHPLLMMKSLGGQGSWGVEKLELVNRKVFRMHKQVLVLCLISAGHCWFPLKGMLRYRRSWQEMPCGHNSELSNESVFSFVKPSCVLTPLAFPLYFLSPCITFP